MNKKVTGIIIVVSIIGLAAGTYFLYRNKRKVYARTIHNKGGSAQPLAWLASLEEGYLKAWATALEKNQSSFVYNNKQYNAKGGKSIQTSAADSATAAVPVYKGVDSEDGGYWL